MAIRRAKSIQAGHLTRARVLVHGGGMLKGGYWPMNDPRVSPDATRKSAHMPQLDGLRALTSRHGADLPLGLAGPFAQDVSDMGFWDMGVLGCSLVFRPLRFPHHRDTAGLPWDAHQAYARAVLFPPLPAHIPDLLSGSGRYTFLLKDVGRRGSACHYIDQP